MPAGYSGTPLAKKLGYKPGMRVLLDNAPDNYRELVDPLPDGVEFVEKDLDMIHLFTDSKKELAAKLKPIPSRIPSTASSPVSRKIALTI